MEKLNTTAIKDAEGETKDALQRLGLTYPEFPDIPTPVFDTSWEIPGQKERPPTGLRLRALVKHASTVHELAGIALPNGTVAVINVRIDQNPFDQLVHALLDTTYQTATAEGLVSHDTDTKVQASLGHLMVASSGVLIAPAYQHDAVHTFGDKGAADFSTAFDTNGLRDIDNMPIRSNVISARHWYARSIDQPSSEIQPLHVDPVTLTAAATLIRERQLPVYNNLGAMRAP